MTEDLPLLIKNPSPELPRAPLKSEGKHFKIWRGDLIIPAWNGWALSSSTWTLGVILSSAAITQITFTCVFAICFFVFTAVLPSWPPVYVASASTSALTTCELLGMPRQWRLQTGAPPPPHHPSPTAGRPAAVCYHRGAFKTLCDAKKKRWRSVTFLCRARHLIFWLGS